MECESLNILITGAAGFIGSSLADKLLLEGNRIINVDNFNDYYDVKIKWRNISSNIFNDHYKLYCLNIENKEELAKVFKNEKNRCSSSSCRARRSKTVNSKSGMLCHDEYIRDNSHS